MGLLDDLWSSLRRATRRRGRQPASLSTSQRPLGPSTQVRRSYNLPIPDIALRPIGSSLEISYELLEMMTWSPEVRHGLSFLARDCFLDPEGRRGSWKVAPSMETGKPLDPEFIAIAIDLDRRYNGKTPVIGGMRLERMVRDGIGLGDSFLQLAIELEGFRSNDYCLSRSVYPPPLTVFIDEDDDGTLNGYSQRERISPGEGDRYMHPINTLHFSYESRGLYGWPGIFQNLDAWRRLKKGVVDVEESIRAVGITPWLHVMPEDRGEEYKNVYIQEYREKQQEGIITDLFLLNGADVKRASQGSASLEGILKYWMDCRYEMILPGIPPYFFPGLGSEQRTGKELANQPAMTYGRLIAAMRSLVGEQIRWAVNLEVLLKKGHEFMMEHQDYDIIFPPWTSIPMAIDGASEEPQVEQVDSRNRLRVVPLAEANRQQQAGEKP